MRQDRSGADVASDHEPGEALLSARHLTKSYGGTRALGDVSFDLGRGEVLALVGENGAGKSTLMAILSGAVAPDAGTLAVEGRPCAFGTPHAAQAAGIGTVFQELSLVAPLSVKENLFAGRAPTRFGLIRSGALRRRARALLDALGVEIDVDAPVGALPMSSRQIVEIAKALSLDARILLLDEPTSALNADEKAVLFRLVARLKAEGVGIIYISHHLDEVLALADRVMVLRDGIVVSVTARGAATTQGLVRDMVGRALAADGPGPPPAAGPPLLRVAGLCGPHVVRDAALELRGGEIVALAGLVGSGRTELAQLVVGLASPRAGTVRIGDRGMAGGGMAAAKRLGIAYVPPERKTEGLFPDLSVADNITAATLPRCTTLGLLDHGRIAAVARRHIERLAIKAPSPDAPCRALSGGNQQKVLMAKWLETAPRLLVVEEPTKGVDIAAKADIHAALRAVATRGAGILMVSSDLPEILALAHRVLVMHRGRIVADLDCRATTEQEIIAHASGLPEDAHAA